MDVRDALLRAAVEMLRPVVRRLLAEGVPFGWLERRLRVLFVEVAESDFAVAGRRPTDSRIALLTAINRKEVRRVRSERAADAGAPATFSLNPLTSLVSRWASGAATTDEAGRPRPLPYRAPRGASFTRLARQVTTDFAPGVLLEQLVASGAAEMRAGDIVALREAAFVPRRGSAQQLQILAEDPAELVETMLRNALSDGERLVQRKVYFDNLGGDAAERIRAEMRRECERFLARVERLLARYDRDRNPRAPGGPRHYAGVGVYFFEAAAPSRGSSPPAPRKRRRREQKR